MTIPETHTIIIDSNPANAKNALTLVLLLFHNRPADKYTSQTEISQAIKDAFGITRYQSSISKALSGTLPIRCEIGKYHFYIDYINGKYQRISTSNFRVLYSHYLSQYDFFKNEQVYQLSDFIFAYNVNPECYKDLKNLLNVIYSPEAFVDIVYHNEKLYLLLNNTYNKVTLLRSKLRFLPLRKNNPADILIE